MPDNLSNIALKLHEIDDVSVWNVLNDEIIKKGLYNMCPTFKH